MKMLIELKGGLISNIIASEPVSVYIIDHDALKEGDLEYVELARTAQQPDHVCDDDELIQTAQSILDEYEQEMKEWGVDNESNI